MNFWSKTWRRVIRLAFSGYDREIPGCQSRRLLDSFLFTRDEQDERSKVCFLHDAETRAYILARSFPSWESEVAADYGEFAYVAVRRQSR